MCRYRGRGRHLRRLQMHSLSDFTDPHLVRSCWLGNCVESNGLIGRRHWDLVAVVESCRPYCPARIGHRRRSYRLHEKSNVRLDRREGDGRTDDI